MPNSPGYKDFNKSCECCGKALKLRNSRDITRRRFCSKTCRSLFTALSRESKTYTCKICGKNFSSPNTNAVFCSKTCSSTYVTEKAYARMDNNPYEYFKHALYKKGREALSVTFMLDLLEKQKGLCAISGQRITFIKVPNSGRVNTNASIDQIVAGAGYTEDNVQLVCDIVNRMKSDLTPAELQFWCKAILEG